MKITTKKDRNRWRKANNPAELFLYFWNIVSHILTSDRPQIKSKQSFLENLAEILNEEERSRCVLGIVEFIESHWEHNARSREKKLHNVSLIVTTMFAIDEIFYKIHPRSILTSPSVSTAPAMPRWLADISTQRTLTGFYSESRSFRLIPRGPFSRHGRGNDASNGDFLADYFTALTVAPKKIDSGNGITRLDIQVVIEGSVRGVSKIQTPGREKFAFIPVAECESDLRTSPRRCEDRVFIDVRADCNKNAVDRIFRAIEESGENDVVILPELAVSSSHVDEIARKLGSARKNFPKIFLAGTYLTSEKGKCGRSWNEARVLNSNGAEIWRQRKNWPFGMSQSTAINHKLPDPGAGRMLMEDIASGDRFCIIDIETFGRCVIFICQDFQTPTVIEQVVSAYQPDWVFVPVLDPGVRLGGWAHQRALSLSGRSQARFVVASSLTMVSWSLNPPATLPPIGLAVGPLNPMKLLDNSDQTSRAVKYVEGKIDTPKFGLLRWNSPGDWEKSLLSVE